MHDINPLGTVMHLKELDRRAAPTLRPMRPPGEHSVRLFAYAMSAVAIVLHALAGVRPVRANSRRAGPRARTSHRAIHSS